MRRLRRRPTPTSACSMPLGVRARRRDRAVRRQRVGAADGDPASGAGERVGPGRPHRLQARQRGRFGAAGVGRQGCDAAAPARLGLPVLGRAAGGARAGRALCAGDAARAAGCGAGRRACPGQRPGRTHPAGVAARRRLARRHPARQAAGRVPAGTDPRADAGGERARRRLRHLCRCAVHRQPHPPVPGSSASTAAVTCSWATTPCCAPRSSGCWRPSRERAPAVQAGRRGRSCASGISAKPICAARPSA